MFVRQARLNQLLSVLFVFTMSACGNLGGCGACGSTGPLPNGKLPTDQTVEGGAQVRVTPQGFTKLKSILPGALNQALNGGFCVPNGHVGTPTGGFLATGAEWCYQTQGTCASSCKANVSLAANQFQINVTNQNTLHLHVVAPVSASIPIRGQVIGIGASCTLNASSPGLTGDIDIAVGVRSDNGELDIHVAQINQFTLNMTFSGCSLLSDIANIATDIVDYCRLVARRVAPDELEATIEGDVQLAGALLKAARVFAM